MDNGVGIGDLLAIMNSKDDGMAGGSWMWVIFLFFIFAIFFSGGNGGLFGGGSGATAAVASGYVTQADLQRGFNETAVMSKLDNLGNGICDATYGVTSQINALGAQMAACCCATQKEIIESRYDAERNACNIVQAIHADGEATRALINSNVMQELRDQLQTANLALQNTAQTQNLISQLRPFPQPAYITSSPYQSVGYCGC